MEKTVASTTIYRGRVATLRVDEVRFADGRVEIREVVGHPGAAAVVALTDEGEAVLVRQYRRAAECRLLEVPAGMIEPGETPMDCARRELAEEAGLVADEMEALITFFPSPGILTEAITVFLARGLRPCPGPVEREEEDLEIERVALERIPSLISSGEIKDAKTLIGLLLVGGQQGRRPP